MDNIADSESATGTHAGRSGPEERIMADLSRNVGSSQVDCGCVMLLDRLGRRNIDMQSKFAVILIKTHPARPGKNEV